MINMLINKSYSELTLEQLFKKKEMKSTVLTFLLTFVVEETFAKAETFPTFVGQVQLNKSTPFKSIVGQIKKKREIQNEKLIAEFDFMDHDRQLAKHTEFVEERSPSEQRSYEMQLTRDEARMKNYWGGLNANEYSSSRDYSE